MKSRSKLLAVLLLLVLLLSIGIPASVQAGGWVYVGQPCTPQWVWVDYPTCWSCYRPYPCHPCRPIKPKIETPLDIKLKSIREEALSALKDLKTCVKNQDWQVIKAERDRWKSARYVLRVVLQQNGSDNRLVAYQITVTPDHNSYKTFYVWSYDCSTSNYRDSEIIGPISSLINLLAP